MEGVLSALRLLNAASESVPVPGFKSIVAVSLHIAEAVDKIRSNKEDCRQLARRSLEIMCGIYEELKHKDGQISDSLQARIQDLESVLCEIEVYMDRRARQRFLRRLIERWKIEDDVQQFTGRLNDAVLAFQLKSMIDVSHVIAQIREELDTQLIIVSQQGMEILGQIKKTDQKVSEISLQTATHAGNLKLYGANDFDLKEELCVVSERIQPDSNLRVVDYLARMRDDKRLVVVKKYSRQDSLFSLDLEKMKEIWHPNIARVEGISRSNIDSPFIIKQYTGGCEALLQNLTGYRLIAFNIRVLQQIASVSQYLATLGFQWSIGTTILPISEMIDTEARVVIDVDWWKNREHLQIPHGIFSYLDIVHSKFEHKSNRATSHSLNSLLFSDLSSSAAKNFKDLAYLVRQWSHISFSMDVCTPLPRRMPTSPGALFMVPDNPDDFIFLSTNFRELPQFSNSGSTSTSESCIQRYESTSGKALLFPSLTQLAVDEKNGWKRYKVKISGGDLQYVPELQVSHHFMAYELGVTHPWLLENVISMAALHNIKAETATIARGFTIYIHTESLVESDSFCASEGPLPDTLYFFARSYLWSHESLDSRPWGYWSLDEHDYPSVETLSSDMLVSDGLVGVGWVSLDEVGWEQALNGIKVSITVAGSLHYDSLAQDEIMLVEELDKWREMSQCHASDDRALGKIVSSVSQ